MNRSIMIRNHDRWYMGLLCLAFVLVARVAGAAEIESLSWSVGTPTPALEILMDGEATYTVEPRENGQWLRLSFPATKLGAHASDLDGLQYVKGVYPSVGPDGTTVLVDVVLEQPGQLRLEKTQFGYTAFVETTKVAQAPSKPVEPAKVAQAPPKPAPAPVTAPAPAAVPAPTPEPAAASQVLNEITDIVYAKLPGGRIQIVVRMNGRPSEPSTFSITNPARVALDFPATRVTMANKSVAVREGAVSSVAAIESEGRTRVVLSLVKPVGYTAAVDGNNYVITVNAPGGAIAGTEQPKTTHFASSRQSGKYSLKGIDFRRGPQADGKIVIKLSDPAVGVDIREQTGEIVVDFLNTSLPLELQRRLDVVDFATPVQTIDTFAQGRNARMVISPKGRYEHVAYQTGDVFTISVKPIIEKPDEKKVDEFGYSGEKLSLNFQNIDVRAALQVLADFTGLNFVMSDSVKGNLTLRLKDVPWDQALDLIVDAKNLAVRRKGNVVTVAPAPEVAAKEKAALESAKSFIELEPLVSELIQINYAKADEIAALLKSIKAVTAGADQHPVFGYTGSGGAAQAATESNSLLSPRGQVTVDARSNSLLIQDTPGKIREIRKLIAKLDQPVRQVLIEARLVEATDNFARSLGVRFGVKTAVNNVPPRESNRAISGTIEDSSSLIPLGVATPSTTGLNVNLASSGVGGRQAAGLGLTLAKLGANGDLLNLELSALEQEGNGKVISSPRVITANQKKAKIEQGQERVFTTSVLGVGSVVTKKATLKLEVTPQVTPDDRINLDVNVTKDNFADSVQGLLNVKEIQTSVLLDNGETVVIGGIYEQDKNETVTKVPLLGDIPLLGWLFKTKDVRDNKTELLIFLTPRIVSENLTLR
jgi:type IV pilus assembly protein PilQ